jgi:hypothetical protein
LIEIDYTSPIEYINPSQQRDEKIGPYQKKSVSGASPTSIRRREFITLSVTRIREKRYI